MLAGGVSLIRAEIVPGQGFTEIRLRRGGRWKGVIGLVGFFVIWLLGGGFAALLLAATSDHPLMLTAWLGLWGLGGLFVLYLLTWNAFGTETLIARADSLTLLRRLLLLGRPTVVPASEIQAMRWVADDPNHVVTVNGRRIPQTALEIAATSRNLRCARGISEAQALTAIAAIKQRLAVSWRRR